VKEKQAQQRVYHAYLLVIQIYDTVLQIFRIGFSTEKHVYEHGNALSVDEINSTVFKMF
jgi:hypothetical protein